MPRYSVFGVFLLCVLAYVPGRARAQMPTDPRYSFDIRRVPLGEALATFSARTKAGVIYGQALVAGKTSTCVIERGTAEAVLGCILKDTGVGFDRLGTGTYVLKALPPPPAAAPAGPTRYTLSGYVRDAATGEALIGAAVYETRRQVGTTANAYGFYSLTLPEGAASVAASFLGYIEARHDLVLDRNLTLDLELRAAAIGMDTVRVEARRVDALELRTEMSVATVAVQQVRAIPSLLGEPDVLRAIQLLPGVQSGNEGTTGLYVRGGSVDQNLVLLDGATVYNPSHLFGFLSIFNARALNDITLVKGGFPARYGGRLSSVLDLSMKEGNLKQFGGEAALGLGAGSLTVEGPLRPDQSSFIVSARRSLVDVAARPFTDPNDYPSYALFDFNAKLNHRFAGGDRVYLSFYGGNDRYRQHNALKGEDGEVRTDFGIRWGNVLSTLRWNHLFSNRLFGNVTLLHTRYRLRTSEEDLRYTRTEEGLRRELFRPRLESAEAALVDLCALAACRYEPTPQGFQVR